MISIGKAIQEAREKRKWSRQDLAERVGCLRQYVYKIEAGYAEPFMDSLRRFAKAFDMPASSLMLRAEQLEEEARKRRVKMISEVAA